MRLRSRSAPTAKYTLAANANPANRIHSIENVPAHPGRNAGRRGTPYASNDKSAHAYTNDRTRERAIRTFHRPTYPTSFVHDTTRYEAKAVDMHPAHAYKMREHGTLMNAFTPCSPEEGRHLMDVLENFERWKSFLGEQVDKAQAMGVSDDQIALVAKKMGDFLANKVDPKNPQERLLKEMWDISDEDEQRTLAKIMVKLADRAH